MKLPNDKESEEIASKVDNLIDQFFWLFIRALFVIYFCGAMIKYVYEALSK